MFTRHLYELKAFADNKPKIYFSPNGRIGLNKKGRKPCGS